MDKQEPVAWYATDDYGKKFLGWDKHDLLDEGFAWLVPLYTAPPKAAEWVGLTDEDIDLYALDIGVTANKAPAWLVTYARDIEAKLREKNGG